MREGSCFFRPNERAATALVLEGNLGLRISDILKLRPCDIVKDGDRYRLEITEQKTGKRRVFTVPLLGILTSNLNSIADHFNPFLLCGSPAFSHIDFTPVFAVCTRLSKLYMMIILLHPF